MRNNGSKIIGKIQCLIVMNCKILFFKMFRTHLRKTIKLTERNKEFNKEIYHVHGWEGQIV